MTGPDAEFHLAQAVAGTILTDLRDERDRLLAANQRMLIDLAAKEKRLLELELLFYGRTGETDAGTERTSAGDAPDPQGDGAEAGEDRRPDAGYFRGGEMIPIDWPELIFAAVTFAALIAGVKVVRDIWLNRP